MAGIALVVLAAAVPASAAGLAKLAITFGSPSPSEGATLTTSSAQFAFTYNRTPKQTQTVTCTLSSPTTTSTGNCTEPAAAGSGSSSGASYSNLANGPYTFTVTVTLTDGGTATAARHFTVAAIAPPCAPTGLTATAGDGSVILNWSAPANSTVSSYNVYEGTAPGGENTATPATTSTTTSATVAGLTNGVTYYFVVTAVNGAGQGAVSNEAPATPEVPSADLSITNTDDTTGDFVPPGGSMNYTIVVSNNGPGGVTGATVSDTIPAGIASDTWAVTNITGGAAATQPGGSGNIIDTVDMPSGSTITFVVHVAIDPAATGTISDTATVSPPSGIADPNPLNNTATDTVAVEQPQLADLSITNTDDTTGSSVTAGGAMDYTIVVSNLGPGDATSATVSDTMPAAIASDSWTVTNMTGGATAATPGGSGNVNDTVDMPSGSTITFVVHVAIDQAATGTISDTATVTGAAWVADPVQPNNTATDTVTVGT